MATETKIEITTDDEDTDVNVDRGDELVETPPEEDKDRDPKGRFAGKDKVKVKVTEKEPEPEDDEAEDEEPVEDEDEDGKQNFPIRLNKAKSQRDEARAQAARAAERAAELEAELKEARGGKEKPKSPVDVINEKLDLLYEQVEDARADANVKEAATLQRQIDAYNREITRFEAQNVAQRTTTVAQQNSMYNSMVEYLESNYAVLDPNNEDEYSQKLADELQFQVEAYEKMDLDPASALRRAATLLFRVDPFAKKRVGAPAAAPKPEGKKSDVGRAVDVSKRQPPDTSTRGVNKDSSKIKVADLSDEDLEKLPASKKAEMRGDFY